jgi:hypothetical protein
VLQPVHDQNSKRCEQTTLQQEVGADAVEQLHRSTLCEERQDVEWITSNHKEDVEEEHHSHRNVRVLEVEVAHQ